jgi:glycerol kinase
MSRELLLALDLGTTGVRALVVRPDGEILSRAYRPLGVSYPRPGYVEQDPDEMWEGSVEVLRKSLSLAGCEATDIAGIGVVNQRSTTVAWDRETSRPLAPAIGWQDQRTSERVAWFRERAIPINTLASATKFEWWMQHDEAVRNAAAQRRLRLGTPDAWLGDRLTSGESHVTDPGNASCTALYDLGAESWAPALLSLFGVPEEALPKIVATSGIVGETPASLLGAPIPVAARAGDQQAASFAQGVHSAGEAKITLGTSAMLDLHSGSRPSEGPPGTFALALWKLPDGTSAFCLEGTVITAGAAVDWLVELGLLSDPTELDRVARSVASTEGVSFVPALQGLGTPFLDDRARGLVGGLTRGTSASHVVRALVEGVAHRCVDVCTALGVGDAPLRADGGLGQSETLLQTVADLLGQEVWRAAETETTALGATHLTGLAVGLFDSPESCRATLAPPTRFAPQIDAPARQRARAAWARALERAASGESTLATESG